MNIVGIIQHGSFLSENGKEKWKLGKLYHVEQNRGLRISFGWG